MGVYVEIDDILNLFGCSDWEIDAQETIYDAWRDGTLPTINISNELIEQIRGTN